MNKYDKYDYVLIDLPPPDGGSIFTAEMIPAWFVLDELPTLRLLVEEGGKFYKDKEFEAAMDTSKMMHDKWFVPNRNGDTGPYHIRILKKAFKYIVDQKQEKYGRDNMLMNLNEGISLILKPLNGSNGVQLYQEMAAKDALGVGRRDEHVQYSVRFNITCEDYSDEILAETDGVKLNETKVKSLKDLQKDSDNTRQYEAMLLTLKKRMEEMFTAEFKGKGIPGKQHQTDTNYGDSAICRKCESVSCGGC
jgi:hypothetical protein